MLAHHVDTTWLAWHLSHHLLRHGLAHHLLWDTRLHLRLHLLVHVGLLWHDLGHHLARHSHHWLSIWLLLHHSLLLHCHLLLHGHALLGSTTTELTSCLPSGSICLLTVCLLLVLLDAAADIKFKFPTSTRRQLIQFKLKNISVALVNAVLNNINDTPLLFRREQSNALLKLVLFNFVHGFVRYVRVLYLLDSRGDLRHSSLALVGVPSLVFATILLLLALLWHLLNTWNLSGSWVALLSQRLIVQVLKELVEECLNLMDFCNLFCVSLV